MQAAYILHNEYIPYQLLWCDEIKEIGNIVQYFKARIRLGEKILILIDNLDNHLSKWNYLVQLLQSELHCHYKLLITSREVDWYNYGGDLSNIQSLKIIQPILEEKEAIEIFHLFREAKQLHPSIASWQRAWNKIAERQLLIEYVYLLTHGEMLSERIASQISKIGQSSFGKVKCEILRKVCFADLCGVRLSVVKLYASQSEDAGSDFGELLKSMESEFLVHVNNESGYVEGLHPIRSKHVIDRLHEFLPVDNTAISVIKIAEKADFPVLFSHLPEFNLNSDEFFRNIVEVLWDKNDLSNYIPAIQGLFSGSVMQYYLSNKLAFDDSNTHGGLFVISTEMCPFATFTEFGVSIDTLDKLKEMFPDNKNIEYLCELRDRIPFCNLQETFVYAFCNCLYRKLLPFSFAEMHTTAQSALITMQNYFTEIIIDFDFQERQLALCVMETQSIEQLIICCSYYQTHSPIKYFNKYQIRNWYDRHCRDERKIAEDGLSELASNYSIHLPNQIYTIDMLSYYPIIVDGLDFTSESNLIEWLYGCISFADTSFDYLIILSANEVGKIHPAALRFPRRMLVDLKKAIESYDNSLFDKLTPPYPVDATQQMLSCFIKKYDLPEADDIDLDVLLIGDIAEELWVYSKSVELLTEPEDDSYLVSEIQGIRTNTDGMLCLLKDKLLSNDFDWLVNICNDVFLGKRFDDALFNDTIEHFEQRNIENAK